MERRLATGGHDGHVRLWDPKTGAPQGDALRGHSKWVMSLAWEPVHLNASSPRLASASKDGTVRVWNAVNRKLEYTLGGHTASVNCVLWGGGGVGGKGVLYTASSDQTVKVWDPHGVSLFYSLRLLAITHADEDHPLSSGETSAHTKRTCTLGEHTRSQHRLRPTYRTLRPHEQEALLG